MRLTVAALLIAVAGGSSACRVADADGKTAWTMDAKPDGGYINAIRFAADGDLVVSGIFKGPFALGDAKQIDSEYNSAFVARVSPTGTVRWLRAIDRDKDDDDFHGARGLAVAADGSILLDVSTDTKLVRVTVSADGATQTPQTLVEAPRFATTSIVGTDSIMTGKSPKTSKCKGTGVPVYRVTASGKVAWSACNPTKTEIDQGNLASHVTSAADGRAAVCSGPAVMAFTAAGKRTLNAMLAEEATPDTTCEGVSIGTDGQVAALFEGIDKTTVLATWTSKGKAGWKKLCTELMKGSGGCGLTTVVADGADLLVGVLYGDKSSIVRLDAKTGDLKASYPFGRASFETFAAAGGAVYYAASGITLGRAE